MSVARTFDLPSHPSRSPEAAERSGARAEAGRAVVLAAILALAAVLLGGAYAYFGIGAGEGYPDATQQWTD